MIVGALTHKVPYEFDDLKQAPFHVNLWLEAMYAKGATSISYDKHTGHWVATCGEDESPSWNMAVRRKDRIMKAWGRMWEKQNQQAEIRRLRSELKKLDDGDDLDLFRHA